MEAQVHQGEKLAALGMVIGGIAHEIRNPLGVSSAAAQLMRRCVGSPELIEECISKVIGGIDRASLVVESLLRFARPGPLRETTRVDVVEVLTNALMFASGEAPAGTTVDWKLPARTPSAYAQGVQNLLELVIINLMLNAFQAMPAGGRMSIELWLDQAEVIIEIGDTGPGISPEHVSQIFDPFFTTGQDQRRSGLGLSVSHSIVRQHGGSLTVRPAAPEGTIFTVRLPAAREAKRAAPVSRGTI
jgi:signal transduction histidine kinase